MTGRNNIIYMATRGTIPPTNAMPPGGGASNHACPGDDTPALLRSHRNDSDAWSSALRHLYELLDALVALRVSFANGTEGDKALSAIGRAKVLEVRTILDTTIHNIKTAIDDIERQRPDH